MIGEVEKSKSFENIEDAEHMLVFQVKTVRLRDISTVNLAQQS